MAHRVPGPARARAAAAGVARARRGGRRGRRQRPRPDSPAPGGRLRDQGGTRSAGRYGPSEALPGRGAGLPAGGKLVPGRPGSPAAAAQHTGRLPSGSSPRGSHLRDGSRRALGGRGGGGGGVGWETGPEVEGEAWRPRAGSAAASATRGQRGELRLCQTRQETFRPCQRRPP